MFRLSLCFSFQRVQGKNKRDNNVKYHCPKTRWDCLVEMNVSNRPSDKGCVVKFVAKHIHVLACTCKLMFLRS